MRNATLRVLLFAGLTMAGVRGEPSVDGNARLQEARQYLTGDHKETEKARKLLLEIVQVGTAAAGSPETLIWAHIYLGYIEDRANNRQNAIGWYEKALTVRGANPSSVEVAKSGLRQALDWIRHLDSGTGPPVRKAAAPAARTVADKFYVTDQPPAG